MALPLLGTVGADWSATQMLLVLATLLVLLYYYYATSYHGVWEKLGVPGPRPLPFIDHMLELHQGGIDVAMTKWFKQYGKTFGAYGILPHKACLVTKDLDLIKQMFVKDFDNFANSYIFLKTKSSFANGIFLSKDDEWRRQRRAITNIFTGAKIKVMMAHVEDSARTLTELVKRSMANNEVVNLQRIANKFSTDVIARIVFGMTTNAISKKESEFTFHWINLLQMDKGTVNFMYKMAFFFPPISYLLYLNSLFDSICIAADSYFISILKSTMKARNKKKQTEERDRPKDMLALLMDRKADALSLNNTNLRAALSEKEIIGNSVSLILAGGGSISTTIQSVLYCLCAHPDVQEKLVTEIEKVIPPGETIQYEHLSQLKYLQQIIQECLRLYPPVRLISRCVAETKTYNGITVPKEAVVQIPVGLILNDPEYFPEPDKFDPERFSPETQTGQDRASFLAFSYGPRSCVGRRLAMMELKVAIVSLLRELRFFLSDRTEPRKDEPMKIQVLNGNLMFFTKPVQVEADFRNDFLRQDN